MKIIRFLFIFLFFITQAAFGVEEKTTLKVGISNTNFSTYEHSLVNLVFTGEAKITSLENNSLDLSFKENDQVQISFANNEFTILAGTEKKQATGILVVSSNSKIGVKNISRKGTPAYYFGLLELKPVKLNKFNLINVLDMQTYLKGVVPNEMPVSFGLEALKAQAVAARNYANRPISFSTNYDVCDSTACQVYFGANSQTAVSNRAVDETLGIYALYDNEIILALYSSTASGITEDYLSTFGDGIENKPYLVSVKDNDELKLTDNEDEIEEFFTKNIPSFDMNSPKHRWQVEFDRFELEDVLTKTLTEQSRAGFVEPRFEKGSKLVGLEDIKVLKRGKSYKALEIQVKSTSGDYVIKKELPIRRTLKKNGSMLPSANFTIKKEVDKELLKKAKKEENTEEPVKEAVFTSEEKTLVERFKSVLAPADETPVSNSTRIYKTKFGKNLPTSFKIIGAGFGHGVGMSQYGAGYLSLYNVDYENILKHYYKGINLGTIPKTVSYNEINLDYIQEFYFEGRYKKQSKVDLSKSPMKKELETLLDSNKERKCYLVIENPNKVSKVEFFINDLYFSPDLNEFTKKVLVCEISKYLKKGKNKITFKPLSFNDRKKNLKFYVTFGD